VENRNLLIFPPYNIKRNQVYSKVFSSDKEEEETRQTKAVNQLQFLKKIWQYYLQEKGAVASSYCSFACSTNAFLSLLALSAKQTLLALG
jgi:tRNA A37 threonylcarbamoyladenosine modification protein TsaB